MKRREFIILSSIGATSASLLSACGHPEEKLIPAFIPDDEYVPGVDYWKASTCGMCPAGCGIIVRTREHKANKIEGNPLHPLNRGALCARGQAGLEVLYNPDRIKGPMKRVGERGEEKWEEISWDEAIKNLADKLRSVGRASSGRNILFATADINGVTGFAGRWLQTVCDASIVGSARANELTPEDYANSYGRRVTPIFDIANATYLLSFGARFLETWHSPVRYSIAYSEFRRASGKARGRFVQIEPRMSLTCANADEWLAVVPGAEGVLALAIAQVIIRENLIKDASPPRFLTEPLDAYAPEKTEAITGIETSKVIRIAREFAGAQKPLAIATGSVAGALVNRVKTIDGEYSQMANDLAIHFLNSLVGNVNKPGGVLLPRDDSFELFEDLQPDGLSSLNDSFGADTIRAETQALLVHGVNPVHSYPSTVDAIRRLPLIVSFSSLIDETSTLADLILPDHSYLESWNIKATHVDESRVAVTLAQPVVTPELNTRQTADVLINISRELAENSSKSPTGNSRKLSVNSAQEVVAHVLERLRHASTSFAGGEGEDFVKAISDRGVWLGELQGRRSSVEREVPQISNHADQSMTKSDESSLLLLIYDQAAISDGIENLPSLQELPDAMTSSIWGSWVEIHPKAAASLGIKDGDLVEVSSTNASVRVPAILYPAIRPDVIAMPYGQGHTALSRYSKDRGANPAVLDPAGKGVVRVRVNRIEAKSPLIRFGTDVQERMEKRR